MTTPLELYREATRRGLRLEPRGDKLSVSPADRVDPEFAATLRGRKLELLEWLNRPPCPGWGALPPDNLALNPVKPCPTPETRETVINFMLRQGCERPGLLTAWLVRRECAYFDGPGRHWDCALLAYAAARDAACWQLSRDERDTLTLLDG